MLGFICCWDVSGCCFPDFLSRAARRRIRRPHIWTSKSVQMAHNKNISYGVWEWRTYASAAHLFLLMTLVYEVYRRRTVFYEFDGFPFPLLECLWEVKSGKSVSCSLWSCVYEVIFLMFDVVSSAAGWSIYAKRWAKRGSCRRIELCNSTCGSQQSIDSRNSGTLLPRDDSTFYVLG